MGAAPSTALGRASTAQEVVAHFGANLAGKTALVTGAGSGIGLETVKALTLAGCTVLATARDPAAAQAVIAAELAGGAGAATPYAGNSALVRVLPLELERLASVRALAAAAEAEAPGGLDFVVLNAGIMALPARQTTPAGFEKQIGVNHFGHHLLVSLLRPRLVARAERARIVYVSSLAHKRGSVDVEDLHFAKGRAYNDWVAYGQSKKANMLEARELADQLRATSPQLTVASLHPGIIVTNLGRHVSLLNNSILRFIFSTFIVDKSIGQGAATTLFACLSPDIVSGEYYSDCKQEAADAEGADKGGALRRRLWEVTEAQLKAAAEAGAP